MWCLDNDVNPRDPQVRFVTNASKLRGLGNGVEVICLEGWTDRSDWWEIYTILQVLRAAGRAT